MYGPHTFHLCLVTYDATPLMVLCQVACRETKMRLFWKLVTLDKWFLMFYFKMWFTFLMFHFLMFLIWNVINNSMLKNKYKEITLNPTSHIPVSYTHLDVYKRQIYFRYVKQYKYHLLKYKSFEIKYNIWTTIKRCFR